MADRGPMRDQPEGSRQRKNAFKQMRSTLAIALDPARPPEVGKVQEIEVDLEHSKQQLHSTPIPVQDPLRIEESSTNTDLPKDSKPQGGAKRPDTTAATSLQSGMNCASEDIARSRGALIDSHSPQKRSNKESSTNVSVAAVAVSRDQSGVAPKKQRYRPLACVDTFDIAIVLVGQSVSGKRRSSSTPGVNQDNKSIENKEKSRVTWRDSLPFWGASSREAIPSGRDPVYKIPEMWRNYDAACQELENRLRTVGLTSESVQSLDGKKTMIKVRASDGGCTLHCGLRRNESGELACTTRKRRMPEFVYRCDHRRTTKSNALNLSASLGLLERVAEAIKLRKRQIDGRFELFTTKWRGRFDCRSDREKKAGRSMFRSSERQLLIHHLLMAKPSGGPVSGANLGRDGYFRYITAVGETGYTQNGYCSGEQKLKSCLSTLKQFVTKLLSQPLDDVQMYYGENIAFYFAWLQLYTWWLILPSLAGIGLFLGQLYMRSMSHVGTALYAIFIATWAQAFVVAWSRKSTELAYRWGVLNYEDEEQPRSNYDGVEKVDPLTKETYLHYPHHRRVLKYCLSVPIVTLCIGIVLLAMYFIFIPGDAVEDEGRSINLYSLQSVDAMDLQTWMSLFVKPAIYGTLIPIMDYLFDYVARFLNDFENHPTESTYQNHLIAKVFIFQSVHVFTSLYYYAFAPSNSNHVKVGTQLASFMISGQVWGNLMETFYPWVCLRIRKVRDFVAEDSLIQEKKKLGQARRRLSGAQHVMELGFDEGRQNMNSLRGGLSEAWEASALTTYSTFDDYMEMMIQFGYVSFFSVAFPLAPLFALVNNLIEIRTDAFKIMVTKQRPLALRAGGIGVWMNLLELMAFVAVATNCAHVVLMAGVLERYLTEDAPIGKLGTLFLLEHGVLFIRLYIGYIYPAKSTYLRRCLRRDKLLELRAAGSNGLSRNSVSQMDVLQGPRG